MVWHPRSGSRIPEGEPDVVLFCFVFAHLKLARSERELNVRKTKQNNLRGKWGCEVSGNDNLDHPRGQCADRNP